MKAILFALFFFSFWGVAFGAPFEEQILEVSTLDGAVLSEPIIGLTGGGGIYLPLLDMGRVLGIQIAQPSPSTFRVYRSESDFEDFDLDGCPQANPAKACEATVILKGVYYLNFEYLKNEWGWPIEADLKALRITVHIGTRAKEGPRAGRAERPLKISRKRFDYPAGRIEVTGSSSRDLNAVNLYESQPLMGQDSDVLYSRTPEQETLRWTLSKEIVEDEAPFDLKSYELLSTQTLDTKYLFSPTQITGFNVSNIRRNETIFDTQNLYEKGPSRWKVELYVNEIYLGETVIDNEGNFAFTDIPVFYGQNKIRYHLVSPVGKTLDIDRVYNVGTEFQGRGKVKYQAAYGQRVGSSSTMGSGLVNYGLTGNISAQAGYAEFEAPRSVLKKSYSLAGLSFLQPRSSLSVSNLSSTTDARERAWIVSPKFNVGGFFVSSEYTKFEDFHTQLINIGPDDRQTALKRASVMTLVPAAIPITAQVGFLENTYDQFGSTQEAQARLFAMFNSSSVLVESNKFWPSDANPDLYVEYGHYHPLLRSRWGVQIQDDRYAKSRIQAESLLPDSYFLTATLEAPVRISEGSSAIGLSKVVNEIQIEGNIVNTMSETIYGVTLSTNLKSSDHGVKLSQAQSYRQADIELFAFVDENGNEKFDAGEKPFPRLRVLHTQRQKEYETDREGRVTIPSVNPYERISFEIVKESISNIFLTARDFQTDYVLTPAQVLRIEIPIEPSFDVKGVVQNTYFRKLLPMEILNSEGKVIGQTTSTADGRYKFTDLPVGIYSVRVSPDFLKDNRVEVTPESLTVEVSGKAGVRSAGAMRMRGRK